MIADESAAGGVSWPRRVLVAHNYYRSASPSGEDAVFDGECRLLERAGINVTRYFRHNDALDDHGLSGRLRAGMDAVWSPSARREILALIERDSPDVVHFHNTFPQISPSAYRGARLGNRPVVQTLHNYRLVCPGALLLREGRPCEDCIGGGRVSGLRHALRHRCYRDSRAATAAVVTMLATHRISGTYATGVDRYIALTRFAASKLAAGGLPSDRLVVKPNFVDGPPVAGTGRGGYAVYVGRLSREKGVETMLAAWERVRGVQLKVIGDGPLDEELRRYARDRGIDVEFAGRQPRGEVLRVVADAALQVVPSECYEGFPMVIAEAYACGTPVVASAIGSLDELVEDGVTGARFRAGDASDLASTVMRLSNSPAELALLRAGARDRYERNYTPAANLRQLIDVYRQAAMVASARVGR